MTIYKLIVNLITIFVCAATKTFSYCHPSFTNVGDANCQVICTKYVKRFTEIKKLGNTRKTMQKFTQSKLHQGVKIGFWNSVDTNEHQSITVARNAFKGFVMLFSSAVIKLSVNLVQFYFPSFLGQESTKWLCELSNYASTVYLPSLASTKTFFSAFPFYSCIFIPHVFHSALRNPKTPTLFFTPEGLSSEPPFRTK